MSLIDLGVTDILKSAGFVALIAFITARIKSLIIERKRAQETKEINSEKAALEDETEAAREKWRKEAEEIKRLRKE